MSELAFAEQTVELDIAGKPQQATLTLPAASSDHDDSATTQHRAAVLLLTDNGPMDRNQNTVHAQLNIFNQVAHHLAERGIISLRYDKRGCGLSKGKFDAAGHSDLLQDAQAWLDHFIKLPRVAGLPVFLLGHGEGALMASRLCADNRAIAGQVLITPFVEDYESIIRRQAENALRDIEQLEGFKGKVIRFFVKINGDQLAKQKKLISRIRKSRRDTLKIRKQVINAKWIREMVNLDAQAIYEKVDTPSLIIGGEKDLQCRPEDTPRVAALLKGPTEHHLLSDLTHILRPDPATPSVQHYLKLSIEDIDPRLLSLTSNWFDQQLAQEPIV